MLQKNTEMDHCRITHLRKITYWKHTDENPKHTVSMSMTHFVCVLLLADLTCTIGCSV